MTDIASQRTSMRLLVGAFFLLALACIIVVSRQRGIWLDELWSQRLGNPRVPIRSILADQWLSDTHPPLANLLYRAVLSIGPASIEAQRMTLNIPALVFLSISTWVFGQGQSSKQPSQVFALLIFVGAMSLPGSMEAFTDFRTYGWQTAAIAASFQYTYAMFLERRLARREHVIGGAALFLALSLHYVTGIVISIYVVGLIAALGAARRLRQTSYIAAISIVAWTGLTIFGLVLLGRMRRDIDFGWITTSTPTGILLFGFVTLITLVTVPLLVVFAWHSLREKLLVQSQRTMALLLIWTLSAGFGALVCVNLLTPIIVQRYLIGWQLALVALLAVLAEPVVRRGRWHYLAVIGVAALMTVVGAVQAAKNTGWRENRDRIADAVRRCPATHVYAMSPWRLKTAHESNSARRETVVIAEGYRQQGREAGFAISVLDLETPAPIVVDPHCPTLVWIEHLDAEYIPDVAYILRVGRLTPSVAVDTRLIASPSGMIAVLRARHPVQNRRAIPK